MRQQCPGFRYARSSSRGGSYAWPASVEQVAKIDADLSQRLVVFVLVSLPKISSQSAVQCSQPFVGSFSSWPGAQPA